MSSYMTSSLDRNASERKRRRPGWMPALAALFFALLTAWLGHWQLDRAQQKRELQARYDARDRLPALELHTAPADWKALLYRRVRFDGVFDNARLIYIDNRIYQDHAGYYVIAPMDFGGGSLLVNRGWMPFLGDHSKQPTAVALTGKRSVEGILVPARSRFFELSANSVQGRVWQNLDIDRYRARYKLDVPEVVLEETTSADDGLVRDWPKPGINIQMHLGYATQWFSLTATIVVLYIYFGVWRKLRHGKD